MANQPPVTPATAVGGLNDAVRLVLSGQEVVVARSWTCSDNVLSQPSSWSLELGSGDTAKSILDQYPVRSLFQLYVGDALQATGRTDHIGAHQSEGGATTIVVSGRDSLAPLQDSYVTAAIAARVTTYPDLVWFALGQCGMLPEGANPAVVDPNILRVDNSANRNIKAGVSVVAIPTHQTVEQILEHTNLGTTTVVTIPPQAKVNETWHRFIRRYLDRAGLILAAAADGTFVLFAPDGNQSPTYTLKRTTGQPSTSALANVIGMSFDDDRTHRHSTAIVYGRGGGKTAGRVKSKGTYDDDEMMADGYNQAICFRDVHTKTTAEGILFARRKIAEERRAGWRLEYTIAGHSLPFAGNDTLRAIITCDTVVAVDDQQLGIKGNFYIEGVLRQRSPQTTTTIRLMRPEDLLFGTDPDAD